MSEVSQRGAYSSDVTGNSGPLHGPRNQALRRFARVSPWVIPTEVEESLNISERKRLTFGNGEGCLPASALDMTRGDFGRCRSLIKFLSLLDEISGSVQFARKKAQ